jgi:hypothetical protein
LSFHLSHNRAFGLCRNRCGCTAKPAHSLSLCGQRTRRDCLAVVERWVILHLPKPFPRPQMPTDLKTTQPPPLLWKPLKVDGWGLFKAVGRITLSLWKSDLEATKKEAFGAIEYVKFKSNDGELAWALVYNSMTRALSGLLTDSKLGITREQADKIADRAAEFDGKLAAADIAIDQAFFDHPGWSEYGTCLAPCRHAIQSTTD